jgi:Helix-turn-helix domain
MQHLIVRLHPHRLFCTFAFQQLLYFVQKSLPYADRLFPLHEPFGLPRADVSPSFAVGGADSFTQLTDCRRIISARLHEQGYSFTEIGEELRRHPTTILRLVQTHQTLLNGDPTYLNCPPKVGQ